MLRLILDALEERGDAMMVVAHPAAGEAATIRTVNGPFARIVGHAADALAGTPVGGLRRMVAAEHWEALMTALRTQAPLDLDMRLVVGGHEIWLGFGLTFQMDADNVALALMLGRDITETRRRSAREAQSQRLLVSIFARISTPVLLVQGDGTIAMSNPAYHRMIGYSAEELVGRNVADLTLRESFEAALRARAAVPPDGTYELGIVMLAKSGARVAVQLTSTLLDDAQDRGLRVTTLIPYIAPPAMSGAGSDAAPAGPDARPRPRSVGQVQAISLAALRDAVGEDWPRVASRALLLAEQIIRHRLDPADVMVRSDDDGFVIWFDGAEAARNLAVLTAATREIRLRFLCDFGEEMACHVSSVVVDDPRAAGAEDVAGTPTPTPELLHRLRREREQGVFPLRTLLQEVRDVPVGQVDPVIGRDGRNRPMVVVDLPAAIRRRMGGASGALAHDVEHGVDLDLVRLKLATRALGAQAGDGKVLVPVSWPALSSPERRWSIDEHLGGVEHRLRRQLVFAVTGVPPLRTEARWRKVVDPLCRQFGEVGLMVTLAEGGPGSEQETKLNEWPISLLVIDAGEQDAATPEGYFELITAARRRNIGVLVRVASAASVGDWRELGCTLFAGSALGSNTASG